MNSLKRWNLELDSKPDFEKAMQRVDAWYQGEIIDRPPVRFSSHNAEFNTIGQEEPKWNSLEERWFDIEYQVESYIRSLEGKTLLGETFPVFWPNLGPNIFAAFYGLPLVFGEVTSWAESILKDYAQIDQLKLNRDCAYFQTIEKLTEYALERCPGKFMVGYTDFHPGVDCVAAWRGIANLCYDLYERPADLKKAIRFALNDFQEVYDHFDNLLKAKQQLSVSWMNIPSFGKMHIPSCDFAAMISNEHFKEFCLPVLIEEVKTMTHNIFHLDGKGVARHLDLILQVPEIDAIQWVQGLGNDKPIMQWIPLIKKIQAAGKSVVVELEIFELEDLIDALEPQGLLLCLDSKDEQEQEQILKRLEKW